MKVVYNSFNGRYADNPRAIFEALRRQRPDAEHVWLAARQHAATFPADVATVPILSRHASAALEAADVVVANCHTDLDPWEKRPGVTYLQTWHGTPLKRIHRAALTHPEPMLMDALDAEIERWDHLLSPSAAATPLLRSAFGYTGNVLETGYPRNDVLAGRRAGQRRAQVRRRLGVSDATTVILYAPTYRDDEVADVDVPLAVDLEALADRLGPDHLLLLRKHYYLGHQNRVPDSVRVRDVSAEPDIAELHLAADVLVTDYSSSIFDFAVTGKPIVLFAYDLEHYRDRLRGFTLDLTTEMPGPVVTDATELADVLADLPGLRREWAERYAAFQDRFCNLDDGYASDRVLQAVWPSMPARA
ncbi:MAG: CDP-glycerol glycerophosphotransferase family protein [Friedmanniella sp.]